MSLEEFQKRIETPDIMEHQRALEKQMLKAQLIFIENILQKTDGEKPSYINLFKEYVDMINPLADRYTMSINQDGVINENKIDKLRDEFLARIFTSIEDIRLDSNLTVQERIEKIFNYLNSEYDSLPDSQEEQDKKERLGLIYFNKTDGEEFHPDAGFKEDDDLLEIHLDPAYKNEGEIGIQDIRKSLSELAVLIVSKYPESKAVVGTSWLFDHPIMKRLGFTILEEQKHKRHNWLQLIDKDGQIDTTRLEETMTTGELPFKNRSGYILIEDFLNKYLPEDQRGEVILRELSSEHSEKIGKIKKEINDLWDLEMTDLVDISYILSKIPTFIILAKEIGVDKEAKELFEICLRDKIPFKKIRENAVLIERFSKPIGKIESETQTKRYSDRKIFIPKRKLGVN